MREYIIFVSKDHYNPLGIARTLGEAGIRPIAIVVKSEPKLVARSKYVKLAHYVETPEEGIQLLLRRYATNTIEKSFILTGDDVTVMTLDKHYDKLKDYFFFYNGGKSGRICEIMQKDYMCALAAKHGFNVAKFWKVKPGEIPTDIEFPVITKAINSFGEEWKSIVRICRNREELQDAYKSITKSDYILLQKYLEKVDEQSYDGFSVNGGKDVFFTIQNNEVYHIPGQYAPYWKNKNVDDKEFIEKARNFLTELRFEGIFEIEFLVGKDNKLYFLEINLRNTVNGWTSTIAGMPLATLWCESIDKGYIKSGIYKKVPAGFTTMAECFDYDVRVKKGLISYSEWLKQYKKANAKLYRGRNDFKPFLAFMQYKLKIMNREKLVIKKNDISFKAVLKKRKV